ncbi:hypothetical protein F383_17691 [Gossypium arboreum]|uniref:Uncharacterized protein n=1 Tax=Gossypium arboreum TaxID=29729 RepID=A0A0B0NHZ7_GOSAR|nr:hypothetical protein F383_17691 [Gossypium arboreum]
MEQAQYTTVVEQIEDGESYLHVLAMEQIVATSLISLKYQESRLAILVLSS